jgi:hypothetical protein
MGWVCLVWGGRVPRSYDDLRMANGTVHDGSRTQDVMMTGVGDGGLRMFRLSDLFG